MHKYCRLFQMAFTVVIVSTLSSALPFAPASAQGNVHPNSTLLGAIWYVANAGSDANSCLVVDSPCETINGALAKAAVEDTIRVAVGTYTGTGTEVVQIDKNIILSGGWNAAFTAQDDRSTIDGQGVRGGVYVNSAPYVVIERFTIRNGSPGIRNYSGTIELNDSLVTRNVGGGIFNDGRMYLSHTLVTENIAYSASAGIWSNGSLTLSHSTVSRNTLRASHAGSGIYTSGMLFLSNSTVTGNTGGEGEGVYVQWGSALLEDSTISANQSYGVTVHLGMLRMHNSILARNGSAGDCRTDDPRGTITSYGYNLIGNSSGCPFTPTTGDLVDVDPKLGQLIGFPGYLPLAAGSPAIDAADPESCSGPDQRGVIRPVGVRCDMGAYEYTVPGSLARLVIADGDEQQTGPNMPFTRPLAVAALDSQGSPVSGVSVTFIAPASGPSGTFADTQEQSTTSITDADGVATASLLTANSLPGAYTVAASASGVETVYFNLQNKAWFVATGGSDSNSCASADSPCGTINGAIGKAAADDIVRVAVGTYTGTGEEVVLIDKNITLSGGWNAGFTEQSGTSTIDGEGARRGITIPYSYPALVVTTTVERFTIQNGSDGGIHKSWGSLTLNDSLVINNISHWMGGGIHNSGTLTINNTIISGNTAGQVDISGGGGGAGISHYQGTLTLNNSTVSNNTLLGGLEGSGIRAHGTLILNNSTVSGNTSSWAGRGTGIYTSFYPILLNNSTISHNQSYGLWNIGADVILQNTIIAMNGTGRDCHDETLYDGTITSHGYNLIGNGSTCPLTATTGDQVGSDANPIDPLLRPLQDTGGPTLIHALMPGSPAIDAGNPAMPGSDESACLATDQRGVTRPQGVRCDIGAYEYAASGSLARLVIADGDEQQTAPDMPFTRPLAVAALDSQGSPVSGVSVTFTAPASGPGGSFADTQAQSTTSITDANGVATASLLTANSLLGTYTVAASASGVEAVYFNLQNKAWFVATGGSDSNSCSTPDSPCGTINGAIGKAAPDEIVRVAAGTYTGTGNEVVLIDKDITLSGGWDQTFTSRNGSSIIDGQTMRRGVYVDWGWNNYPANRVTASLDHFIIKNGSAGDGAGGGIANNGNLTITNSSIYDNFAAGGAGVWNAYDRILTLVNVTVSNNSASVSYGGIWNDSGTVFINNSTITANSGETGAGIRSEHGMTYLRNTIIAGNLGNDCNGRGFSAQGNNLIGNNENCSFMPNLGDDLVGTPADPIDPRLGPLQDNGSATFTHALLADSPAIDAGPEDCGPVDQRGMTRPQGERCDIGAYELVGSVEISVGGGEPRFYVVPSGEGKRVSLVGVNSGPVKITDTRGTPLVVSERVVYKVMGSNTSFSEMMALPDNQIDMTYWLPWYNNVDLDTQLRFANVTGIPATVHVSVGGVPMAPINLAAGESTRVSFAGVNSGPVKIESNVNIVAAERVIYKVKGVQISFSEMMALPESQLDNTYWLPWYNNRDLDTQLRIANVTDQPASVQVFIGGVEMQGSPFALAPGESTRKSFPGISNGPVQIVSDHGVPIVASERLIYKVDNVPTSFSEMMALPASQLDTTYWLPWYNNLGLDTQLRFANTTPSTATVHIYVGGAEMTGSPFTLLAGESTRRSFAGVDNGPVQIVSDVPIVAAERVIYKVNGVATSFTEMMALPEAQLDTIYWFPWYNNADLDTQLRFGVP